MRTDIQALRALAVAMVLVYHLWPTALPGGYIGVDAFFVISGFLITSHLVTRVPRTPTDLASFWSRRIRRLFPAALLVLAVTLAGTRLLAPNTAWGSTASQARDAALYVVNWRLAADAVDYLASHNAPTAVQHYWSLSVEEQFYLLWPVLILLLALVARRTGLPTRTAVVSGLGVVVVASFWYSVHETAAAPARAYFITPTRMWELGVGGLLAAAVAGRGALTVSPRWRSALALSGFLAVLAGGVLYGPGTAFPGWRAALPALGTAAVIAARAPDTGRTPGRLLATRPVQWLGDVSYSLYLWHWPLIVLTPDVTHRPFGVADGVGVLLLSLVLAGLTKRFVEDPFRRPAWARPLRKPYAFAAAAMALVVGATVLQSTEVEHLHQQAASALRRRLSGIATPVLHTTAPSTSRARSTTGSIGTTPAVLPPPVLPRSCFGAAALTPSFHCVAATRSGTLTPSPLGATTDRSDAYSSVSGSKNCFAYAPGFATVTCTRGDVHGRVDVALVGNSHAGEWLPAVEAVARRLHWRVTTYLASQCAFARTSQRFPNTDGTAGCNAWTTRVTAAVVAHHYDLVVLTNRISVDAVGANSKASRPLYERGYASVLGTFAAAHLRVLGIRDTPAPGQIVPDCLGAHPSDYLACAGRLSSWLPPEPLTAAIAALHNPRVIEADLTDRICAGSLCPAAVGGVPVYVDGSHMTATYALTLAPYLAPYLLAALHTP